MTRKLELTRRKILASVGAVGAAGAGAGLGTSALFSDEESFTNNLIQAGTLNLEVTLEIVDASSQFNLATAAGNDLGVGDTIVLDGENTTVNGTPRASTDAVTFTLDDLKPGDYWIVCTTVKITGNPGYAQVYIPTADGDEGTNTEPELAVDTDPEDDAGDGPLFARTPRDNVTDGDLGEKIIVSQSAQLQSNFTQFGTLDHYLKSLGYGLVFEGPLGFEDPRAPHNPTVIGPGSNADVSEVVRYTKFELPASVGNVIQGDTLTYDVKFQAEQWRNNPDNTPFNN